MILEEIVAHKRSELAERISRRPHSAVAAAAALAAGRPDFRSALTGAGLAVIGEIKGASPSTGTIRPDFDPLAIVRAYEAGGAVALSVLTDEKYFRGTWEMLSAVCGATVLPVLCKEFVIDLYQIDEARIAGASAVLLIVRVLEGAALRQAVAYARRRGMHALVEVHTAEEVHAALEAGAEIIGINNRDLQTLQVDLDTTARLRPLIPPGVVVVSESGFERREQVEQIAQLGVDAVLVGTTLMASSDPAAKLRELRGV